MNKESRQQSRPSSQDMAKRLKNFMQDEPVVDLILGTKDEGKVLRVSQQKVAPWRPRTRRGMRIGRDFILDYQQTELSMVGDDMRDVTTTVALACKTKVGGEPKIRVVKLIDDEPVPADTAELLADVFTVLDHAQAQQKNSQRKQPTADLETEPTSQYQRFAKEHERIFNASLAYIPRDKPILVAALQLDDMIVRVIRDTKSTQKEIKFDLTLPKNDTRIDKSHIAKKYYYVNLGQQLKEYTLMQGDKEPTTDVRYTPVGTMEAEAVLSILESLTDANIQEQLKNRQRVMSKARRILDSHGEASYSGDRVSTYFTDREPRVSLTKMSPDHIQIALELYLSRDGINTEISIIKDDPIKTCKRRADDNRPQLIWKPASPAEVTELLALLDELQ